MHALGAMPFDELLRSVAAKTPTPGGGAVAAAAGSLAAALAEMVVAYSVDKKSLADHRPALAAAGHTLSNARALLLQLADEDAAAYSAVNEMSRLPESDPGRDGLAAAVAASVQVPGATIAACTDLLRLMEDLAPITNPRLRSDLAIAAILAEGAARASRWNVVVNAASLPDGAREGAVRDAERGVADAAVRRERVEGLCG